MEKVPAGQALQDDEPDISDIYPASQTLQVVDPRVLEYSPKAQLEQDVEPTDEIVPSGHIKQVTIDEALIATEYVPAAQFWQEVEPDILENLPASQETHLLDSI
jgi:hypothetical protein